MEPMIVAATAMIMSCRMLTLSRERARCAERLQQRH